MEVLIESVPNFSEGRRTHVIGEIADSILSVPGVKLLNVDIGADANRTVFTLVGSPERVCLALFKAASIAIKYVDMREQEGNHPRIGVLDVCPLIPLKGISIEELNKYAYALGEKFGKQLSIPVFYYEESAKATHKKDLADIRRGEYEGLCQKMKSKEWHADNKLPFNEKTGATVVGARNFLLAYNVNLESKDENIAKQIAQRIRESGYLQVNKDGEKVRIEGLLKRVKAIGWFAEEFQCAQVSTNITDTSASNLAEVFLEVKKMAAEYSVEVKSSELIGMLPQKAVDESLKYLKFEEKENREATAFLTKILGLDAKNEFNLKERIIENLL